MRLGYMIHAALCASTLVCLVACEFSKPIEAQHPTIQKAPASVDESTEAKRDALRRTIVSDFGCDNAQIVLTFPLRYLNSVGIRYVVEGCGVRALYAETCESYPVCRYLLVSKFSLSGN